MFWHMSNLVISPRIDEKLKNKHNVTRREVEQCFDNKCGFNLIDNRENNRTDPPTLWFIAETNHKRLLKIVYTVRDGVFYLKTACEPIQIEIDIYNQKGK